MTVNVAKIKLKHERKDRRQ